MTEHFLFVYMDSLDNMYVCASHTSFVPENKGAADLLEPGTAGYELPHEI